MFQITWKKPTSELKDSLFHTDILPRIIKDYHDDKLKDSEKLDFNDLDEEPGVDSIFLWAVVNSEDQVNTEILEYEEEYGTHSWLIIKGSPLKIGKKIIRTN